jgi:hypothetical protein
MDRIRNGQGMHDLFYVAGYVKNKRRLNNEA